jgi:hypothetical protein
MARKWSIPGWLVLVLWLGIQILDWIDRLQSAQSKLSRMMPALRPFIDFIVSPPGQYSTLAAGLLLLWASTWRKFNRTPIITEEMQRELQERRRRLLSEQGHDESIQPPPPDFSNPAYDRFWPSSWRDGLITRGQRLVEQWTTRLDYPEKQRRENESRNWLCETDEFAGKHLAKEQMNEFTLRHGESASGGKKFEFGEALRKAGTEPGDEDGNLAFEIFGKVKLLERFRSELMPPS